MEAETSKVCRESAGSPGGQLSSVCHGLSPSALHGYSCPPARLGGGLPFSTTSSRSSNQTLSPLCQLGPRPGPGPGALQLFRKRSLGAEAVWGLRGPGLTVVCASQPGWGGDAFGGHSTPLAVAHPSVAPHCRGTPVALLSQQSAASQEELGEK